MNNKEKAKFCQSSLKFIIFVILGVICYFYLMEDAIKKSEKRATTITSRQENSGFEYPAIIICPYPGFKPSLSQKLEYAAKDLFRFETSDKHFFDNKTAPKAFEEYTYGDNIKISAVVLGHQVKLFSMKEGETKFKIGSVTQTVELKKVPTTADGICHVILFDKVIGNRGYMLVEHSDLIDSSDIPRHFSLYLLSKNEWKGIITKQWLGENPFKIDTSSYSFPFVIQTRLKMNQLFPLDPSSKGSLVSTQCIDTNAIKKIREAENCKEVCIPIQFRSLFDRSETKICADYDDQYCAYPKIQHYITKASDEKQILCTKENFENSYKGQVVFSDGMPYQVKKMVSKERTNNLLFFLVLNFDSDHITVQEEKLLYDSKDLLAWIGGALGIFVGYSIFDLASQILDWVFQVVCKFI